MMQNDYDDVKHSLIHLHHCTLFLYYTILRSESNHMKGKIYVKNRNGKIKVISPFKDLELKPHLSNCESQLNLQDRVTYDFLSNAVMKKRAKNWLFMN